MALPSNAGAYDIRRLRGDDPDDLEALFRFIARAWGPDSWHLDRARWDWQFRQVPTVRDGETPLFVFTRGNEILGQLGVTPVSLSVGDTIRPAAFAFDIMILREYWNRGAFALLLREFCRSYPIVMGLGMNDKAYGLFQALKWIHIGQIPRLERYRSWRAMRSPRTLVALARQAPDAVRGLRPLVAPASLTVHEVERFDERVTELWDRSVGERIGVRRTATWLNWRFGPQPRLRYERLVIECGTRLVGCVVLRVDASGGDRVGYVVECFAEPPALDEVVRAAVARLDAAGVDRIVCDVLDAPTEAALRRLGFVYRRVNMRFMLQAADAAVAATLGDRGRWYITRGDADQDRPA